MNMKRMLFCLMTALCVTFVTCAKPETDPAGNKQETPETPETPGTPDTPDNPDDDQNNQEFTLEKLGTYEPVRILFIGNSHTLDATDLLPLVLNGEGVKNIEFTRVYHGGYYLVGYNANYDNPTVCSISSWQSGQNMWRGHYNLTHTLREAVEAGPYDVVVMQEYTGNAHCWTWDDTERAAIHGLCDKIREYSPKAHFIYYISHCHASSYSISVKNFGGSHEAQFETCINNNALHVMDPEEGFPFEKIISTAALIENLRTSGLDPDDGTDMLRGDGCHLDYGFSRLAASMLFWKTIFTPITGIDAKDVRFRIHEWNPGFVRRMTPATDDNWPLLMAAVQAAYDHPYEITDLSSFPASTQHKNEPGTIRFDGPNVEISPVSFPVRFPVTYAHNTGTSQGFWNGYALWLSSQPQAYARWIPVSFPVEGMEYGRTFANSSTSNISSVALDAIWTGDYFEFTIPVKNFKAGTSVRFTAPFYTRQGPCFWYLDYQDGEEWKTNHDKVATWDGTFERDASFAIGHGQTLISQDVTFENAVQEGYLRFRIRCADGSIQASADGAVQRPTPNIVSGKFSSVFYFWGDPGAIVFSIVE